MNEIDLKKRIELALQDKNFKDFNHLLRNYDNSELIRSLGSYSLNPYFYQKCFFKVCSLSPRTFQNVMEVLLNNRFNCGAYSENRNPINDYIASYGYFFGDHDAGGLFILNLVRMALLNPCLLKKQVPGNILGDLEQAPLHSIIESINDNLNEINGKFRFSDASLNRKKCMENYLVLLTLIVLISPQSLQQKKFVGYANDGIHEKNPMTLFQSCLLAYGTEHQNMKVVYDNFNSIIQLTQSGNHILSEKIRELIEYTNTTKLDSDKLKKIVNEVKSEISSQGDSIAEEYISRVGNIIIDNLTTILLDKHPKKRRDMCSSSGLLQIKRDLLVSLYDKQIGRINEVFVKCNLEAILSKCNEEQLDNFMKALLYEDFFKDLNDKILNLDLNIDKQLDWCLVVNYINGNKKSVIKPFESLVPDFLNLKQFLDNNPAPHETKYEEKQTNKKVSEEALENIRYLYLDKSCNTGSSALVNPVKKQPIFGKDMFKYILIGLSLTCFFAAIFAIVNSSIIAGICAAGIGIGAIMLFNTKPNSTTNEVCCEQSPCVNLNEIF